MLQRSSSKSSRQMLTIAQEDESSNDRLSHTNDSVRSSARPSAENMANELRDRRSRMSQGNRHMDGLTAYCNKRYAFVEKPLFEALVVSLIIANMGVFWLETDSYSVTTAWPVINASFLAFFCLEFLMRMLHRGPELLISSKVRYWYWYDTVVLLAGILDMAAIRNIGDPQDALHHVVGSRRVTRQELQIARVLSLSRLLRVFRLTRMVPKFEEHFHLIRHLLWNSCWIWVTLLVFHFLGALVLTRVIGHGLMVKDGGDTDDESEARALFADLRTSVFTLFRLTTVDDWYEIAMPLTAVHPGWMLFFVCFIVVVWVMLSLLTAVASETIINGSSSKKEAAQNTQEVMRGQFIHFMCQEFGKADADNNGMLSQDEFGELMNSPDVQKVLHRHGFNAKDVVKMWNTFDVDDSGELSIEELVNGFALLQENLTTMHVTNVGYRLKRLNNTIGEAMGSLEEAITHLGLQQDEALSAALMQKRAPKPR